MDKDETKDVRNLLTSKFAKLCYVLILIIAVLCTAFVMGRKSAEASKQEPYVVTESALEKIVKISKLSTFEAVYNGVAQVYNEKDALKVDYYVSYEAVAKVGIDVNEIKVLVNDETKKITISLPALELTEVNVDEGSLDFIFYNDKRNTLGVTQEALEACKKDARIACTYQESIYELASKNAKRIVTALVEPFLNSLDCEYTLIVNQEATRR